MFKPLDPLRKFLKTALLSSSKLTPFLSGGTAGLSLVVEVDCWPALVCLPAIMEVDLSFLEVLGLTLPSRLGGTKNVPSLLGTEVLWDKVLLGLEELRLKEGRRFFFWFEQSLGILKTHLLWKLRPQPSHFRPCLNMPKSISPQKWQKVGVL